MSVQALDIFCKLLLISTLTKHFQKCKVQNQVTHRPVSCWDKHPQNESTQQRAADHAHDSERSLRRETEDVFKKTNKCIILYCDAAFTATLSHITVTTCYKHLTEAKQLWRQE